MTSSIWTLGARRARAWGTLVLCLVAGQAMAETVERIVAKVNGQIITLTELDAQMLEAVEQMGPEATPDQIGELRRQVLDRMIDNLLVLQVAEDRGLRVPSRFFEEWKKGVMEQMKIETEDDLVRQVELQGGNMEMLRKRFEDGLLLQEVRRMEVDSKVSVSEPEINERYQQNIHDYSEPARVRLREIVVRFDESNELDKGEKIRRILQDVQQGADFAEMARLHSESGSAEAGGDLGFWDEGDLTEPLGSAAFKLSPGEVSEIIRLPSAFYIIRVEEKIEAKTKPLEEVRSEVADAVFQEKLEAQMERYIRQLRERAIIEIKL
ncbi:MAG TPA: peptidyl-prolyl cis-trans isomerase [Vicinamibacteria bacterium]|nr:peptidyl-prolyl cis-trans isomerase [Vicinamibacteria bacterium]